MVASGHRETTVLKLIVIYVSQRFRIRADVDELWQTVQPGSFSEKQAQWLTLQLYLLTVGVESGLSAADSITFSNK